MSSHKMDFCSFIHSLIFPTEKAVRMLRNGMSFGLESLSNLSAQSRAHERKSTVKACAGRSWSHDSVNDINI